VPAAPVVHTDDPGWRVGGASAVLMACETDAAPGSQVRPRPRHAAVQEGMPADDIGVLTPERGRRDAAPAVDDVRPHTGLAHLQRSRSDGLVTKTGRARDCGERWPGRRQDAWPRWPDDHDGTVTDVATEATVLREERTSQRRARPLKDPDHPRRLHDLGWHHDRGNLVRFLDDPRIEPTNNRAERALRPAVMARQVAPCSQNGRGAHAFEVFPSVGRTRAKHGTTALVEGLDHLCRSPNLQAAPP
jgi:transposase